MPACIVTNEIERDSQVLTHMHYYHPDTTNLDTLQRKPIVSFDAKICQIAPISEVHMLSCPLMRVLALTVRCDLSTPNNESFSGDDEVRMLSVAPLCAIDTD